MKLNKIAVAIGFAAAVSVTAPAMADTNRALEAWKTFAAEQNDPKYDKWVELISDPKAIQMAKEWKELRGYDAYDLMDKADLPAEMKAGLVITGETKANYPWLKDYLPKEIYDHLGGEWGTIGQIKIVPTNTYYMHHGYLKNTQELKDKNIKIVLNSVGFPEYEDGTNALMSGPAATAIPFLNPKNGLELQWSFVAHSVNNDTLSFGPLEFNACSASGHERGYKADLWWWHYHNRSNVGPMGDIEGKEDFVEGGAIFFLEPNDIRGLAAVRQRYADPAKEDDFKVFIPSLRRTRLLTGSDSQDPMASGLEITWDDWRGSWAKTNITNFEYKIAREGFVLAQPEVGHAYNTAPITADKCGWESMEVELRPIWVLEVTDKTGKYQYSKRETYVDKEFYYLQYQMTWDPRGNPYRTWEDSRDWRPSTGDAMWKNVIITNEATQRHTTLEMTPIWENRDEDVSEEMFDVDQLRDYQ
ncbi:MAG: outer membrane lipoprotein-sorting protein [Cycloclasticus sp.]|nr:outer membrane lipoprotein-sorting protein [Cycloclasticus sp.]